MTEFFHRVTITAKGQVTLRRSLLDHIGVRPGEKLEIVSLPDGRLEMRAAPKGRIEAIFGMIKHDGTPPLTIEEINEITAKGWAGEL